MRDEIDSRLWVEHGHAFSQTVADFLARAIALGAGLRRLNEMKFEAPWKRDVRRPGQA
ncbi:MAG: hypothetical protein ABIW83_09405 [Allosphingosinicella sp.]